MYYEISLTLIYTDSNGYLKPITNAVESDFKLIDVGEMYGTIIYPDNVKPNRRHFANLGNGNYAIGYFDKDSFLTNKSRHYVKVNFRGVDNWKFGVFMIGKEDENYLQISEISQTIRGDKNFYNKLSYNSDTYLSMNFNENKDIPHKMWIEDKLTQFVDIGSLQYISGTKQFLNLQTPTNPSTDYMVVNRGYLNTRLQQNVGFVQTPAKRRVGGSTTIANDLYPTIASAIASCPSPSAMMRYTIEIDSQGIMIPTPTSEIVQFCDLRGINRLTKLLFHYPDNTPVGTVKNVLSVQNCTIYLGSGEYSPIKTPREYKQLHFYDVNIYAYNDTTFNNCILENCNVFHVANKKAIIKNGTNLSNVKFNNSVILDNVSGLLDFIDAIGDRIIPEGSMPNDPTSIPE